jgi:NAD(P)-dependent dehydrogenase (short-subunit alcohol dehydrogenase family)
MSALSNKIGLVTGSGQGIGRAIALSFAREGAKVVVADFNEEMGQQTVELITNAGGTASFIYGDISKEDTPVCQPDPIHCLFGIT